MQQSAIETDREVKAFRKAVPEADRRAAITGYLEARGNDALLSRRAEDAANAGNAASAAQHQAARSLTPGELAAADLFQTRMNELHDFRPQSPLRK